jgi:hypothetical protein
MAHAAMLAMSTQLGKAAIEKKPNFFSLPWLNHGERFKFTSDVQVSPGLSLRDSSKLMLLKMNR